MLSSNLILLHTLGHLNKGKVLGDWGGSGYKEGLAGQAIQKSGIAVNAHDGSPKCNFPEALFLLYNKQR